MKDDTINSESESTTKNSNDGYIGGEPAEINTTIINKASKNKKRTLFVGLAVSIVFVSLGLSLWLISGGLFNQTNNGKLPITIGAVTITQKDVDKYVSAISAIEKRGKNTKVYGNPKQLAIDDLIMNAALRKESFENNQALTDQQIKELYKLPDNVNPSNFYNNKSSYDIDSIQFYESLKKDINSSMLSLDGRIIDQKTLFVVSVPFDTKFFNSQTNQKTLKQIHTKAKNQLKNEILPLFINGKSREDIIKKVDINSALDVGKNNILYQQKPVTVATSIQNYNSVVGYSKESGVITPTNFDDVGLLPQKFSDQDNADYGIKLQNLEDTNKKTELLENKGDHTAVFTSKTGAYMIMRLENKTDNKYNNWKDFLEIYKKDVAKIAHNQQLSSHIANNKSKAIGGAKRAKDLLTKMPVAHAQQGNYSCNVEIGGLRISGSGNSVKSDVRVTGSNSNCHRYATLAMWDRRNQSGLPLRNQILLGSDTQELDAGHSYVLEVPIPTCVYWQADLLGQQSPTSVTNGNANYVIPPDILVGYMLGGQGNTGAGCQQPTGPECTLTVTPSTLPAGGGTVTVRWTSSHNQSGYIDNGIGELGNVNTPTDRFGEDTTVNVSQSTTFTGRWTADNGGIATCQDSVTVGGVIDVCPNIDGIQDRIPDGLHFDANGDCVGPTTRPPPTFKPYLRVYGNDVIVGSAFSDTETCGTNSSARIRAFTHSAIEGGRRISTGSSGQYGVFDYAGVQDPDNSGLANGIENFFSDNLRSKASVQTGYGWLTYGAANDLTFGNYYVARPMPDPRHPGQEIVYGGRVGGYGGQSGILHCIPDYYKRVTETGRAAIPGGTMSAVAPTLASPIDDGQREVVVVNGNLYIDKNIEYKNADTVNGWSSIDKIPSVVVIVKGNISISPDVTRLDGIFVAQPDDSNNKGEIYTCGDSTGPLDLQRGGRDVISEICRKKLTINGSFIAKKAVFYRTNGSVLCPDNQNTVFPESRRVPCEDAAPNEPADSDRIAEVFNFSPEAYMTPLNVSLQSAVPFQKYDSITSLPPVF